MTRVNITVDERLLELTQIKAQAKGMTYSKHIRECLLNDLVKVENNTKTL